MNPAMNLAMNIRITLSALVLLLASCAGKPTEILVVVDSDLAIPAGLDTVRVEVNGAMTMSASGTLTGADAQPLPRTVGIVYQGGSLGPLEISAVGSVMGGDVVSASASTSFIRGRTLVLPLFLSRRCVGASCGNTETCEAGSCVAADVDPSTLTDWNGTVSSPDGGSCTPGTESCNGADDDCDGRIDEGFDLQTDPLNCGTCGNACSATNGMASCSAGSCSVGCDTGFGDCNGDPTDGCETDLQSTATDCGTCGNACSFANASASCASGACSIGACDTGFDDCNADPTDGCEASLSTTTDCGSCGMSCTVANGTPSCTSGSCAIDTCDAGFDDCNGDVTDGCETSLDTLTDCGTCGTSCDVTNGTPSCASGSCAVDMCDAGFGDCDSNVTNGCETPLDTLTDCGACGTACSVANGTATCATGMCAIDMCNMNRADCNSDPSDGCEVNLRSSDANCGMCGMACPSGQSCHNSMCH